MSDEELTETIGEHTGQIQGLLRWQQRQNGTLQTIEARLRRVEALLALAVGLGLLNVMHGFKF